MSSDLFELLLNALNEQGYLFRESCEHALKNSEKDTGWEVKTSEYPVTLEGQDTRVDIVLRSKISSSPELYALIECKRADPTYIYWVFGSPGLPRGDALCSALGVECREYRSDQQPYQVNRPLLQLHFEVVTYDAINWLEARRGSRGRSSTPQNIENAFGQVLRGVGGFAQEQIDQHRKSHALFKIFFIPVVVTTASLYVANYELSNIDLCTGKISQDKVLFGPQGQPPEEKRWVLVHYGSGENVAPKSIPDNYHGVDPAELQKHKIRSIFVVNSQSLVSFFSKLRLAL
jgi:hypothetical protein